VTRLTAAPEALGYSDGAGETAMIDGILIEGSEQSGKTTVCHLVASALAEHGIATHVGHGYIHANRLLDRFLTASRKASDLLELDWYYSANILLDLTLCRRALPREFVVQDRHWYSQVARNEFFHGSAPLPTELIEAQHIPFTYNVFLKSNLVTKLARARARRSTSMRDAYLRKRPVLHQSYDEYLERRLPRDERWQVIDTSALSPDEVAARIVAPVLRERVRAAEADGAHASRLERSTVRVLRDTWRTN
jgi:thymidylate kinase